MAAQLRRGGLSVEVYPEAKKLGAQLKYADEKGFDIAIVAGTQEWESGQVQVKDLKRKIAITAAYTHDQPGPLVSTIGRILDEAVNPTLATE
jgi:histidyl-tRNA synthetase